MVTLAERCVELKPNLVRFLWKLTGNGDDAEDLWAELYVRAVRWSEGVDREESVQKVWLYRAARNLVVDLARRSRPECRWEDVAGEGHCPFDLVDDMLDVDQALSKLRSDYAPVVWLDGLGYSAKEGAEMLGLTRPAYKSRLYRARPQMEAVR